MNPSGDYSKGNSNSWISSFGAKLPKNSSYLSTIK